MRAEIDLGFATVGVDRPDADARAFFEDEGVGTVVHARLKTGRRERIGRLWMQMVDPRDEDAVSLGCLSNLDALVERHPKQISPYLVGRIRTVIVGATYRNRGVGTALYIVAAAFARRRHRAAIVADGCFEDGSTSEYAYRVWTKSPQLRAYCDVEGLSAFYAEPLARKVPRR